MIDVLERMGLRIPENGNKVKMRGLGLYNISQEESLVVESEYNAIDSFS